KSQKTEARNDKAKAHASRRRGRQDSCKFDCNGRRNTG
nr:hypothetical protein [Tanacetum cinerariifolium]